MAGFVGPEIPGVTDGLVFYVDAALTYTSGSTTWYDEINGNNGTLTNGPTYSTEGRGSIEFDGTDDYVDATSFVIPSNITICAWVKPDATGTQQIVTSDDSTTPIRNWQFRIESPGIVRAVVFHTSGNNNIQAATTDTLSTGQWVMLTFTADGTNLKVYFNGGVEKASSSFPYSILGNGSAGDLLIGARRTPSPTDFINGNVSLAMIYDRGLSSTEILKNYNALKGRFNL